MIFGEWLIVNDHWLDLPLLFPNRLLFFAVPCSCGEEGAALLDLSISANVFLPSGLGPPKEAAFIALIIPL
jgi:hypothetical protein